MKGLDLRRGMLDHLKGVHGLSDQAMLQLTNGALGARLSSGSAASNAALNDRL